MPLIAFDRAEGTFVIRGLGVFHGDRLVGELSGRETRAFGLLTARAGSATLQVPLDKIGRVTYRRVRSSSKVTPFISGSRLGFLVKVSVQGFLIEMTKPVSPISIQLNRAMELATAHAIEDEMARMVRRLQELNSDILGFGELLRATRPKIWRRINWDKEFPRASVRIEVNFTIARTGTYR